jgi:hypothetical protein
MKRARHGRSEYAKRKAEAEAALDRFCAAWSPRGSRAFRKQLLSLCGAWAKAGVELTLVELKAGGLLKAEEVGAELTLEEKQS